MACNIATVNLWCAFFRGKFHTDWCIVYVLAERKTANLTKSWILLIRTCTPPSPIHIARMDRQRWRRVYLTQLPTPKEQYKIRLYYETGVARLCRLKAWRTNKNRHFYPAVLAFCTTYNIFLIRLIAMILIETGRVRLGLAFRFGSWKSIHVRFWSQRHFGMNQVSFSTGSLTCCRKSNLRQHQTADAALMATRNEPCKKSVDIRTS